MSLDNVFHLPPIVEAIMEECRNREISIDEALQEHVQIARVYFNSLINGNKDPANLSVDVMRRIAHFIRRPLPEVELICGAKQIEDYFIEESLDDRLRMIYRVLKQDPQLQAVVPQSQAGWNALPQDWRLAIAVMYEKMTSELLIKRAGLIKLEKKPAPRRKAG